MLKHILIGVTVAALLALGASPSAEANPRHRQVTRPANARVGQKNFNPLLFAFVLNKARGQDNQTAARNALIGHAVGNATAGIAQPVVRAVVAPQLTSKLTTGAPASTEAVRTSALRAAIRDASGGANGSE